MPMILEITTAERQVYGEEVDMVIAPGIDGQLGILPRHAPLMTILQPGELTIRRNGADSIPACGTRETSKCHSPLGGL